MQLLQEARESSKKKVVTEDTPVEFLEETNSNIHPENENKTDISHDDNLITVEDAMIKLSNNALKSKLKGTGAAIRLAKSISIKRRITTEQLNKAFIILRRHKPAHINYQLVGGNALFELKCLLEKGVSLRDALITEYKGIDHEKN
jgi:hypothetical protein